MPGYVIHLATANVHLGNFSDVSDPEAFLRGVIAPDMIHPKTESHFGEDTACPDLNLYIDTHDLQNSYERGYFFHLLTDFLFYGGFMRDFVWTPAVYDDYDRLNRMLMDDCRVAVPDEVLDCMGFRDGGLEVFGYDRIRGFIDSVGKIDLDGLLQTRAFDELRSLMGET